MGAKERTKLKIKHTDCVQSSMIIYDLHARGHTENSHILETRSKENKLIF